MKFKFQLPNELNESINTINMTTKEAIRNSLKEHLGDKLYFHSNIEAHLNWQFEKFDIIPKSISENSDIHPSLSLENLEKCICKFYQITPEEFKRKDRHPEPVWRRQMFSYIARQTITPNYPFQQIGNYIGMKHCSILHSVKTVKDILETEAPKRLELHRIKELIMEIVEAEKENDTSRELSPDNIQIKDIPYPKENPTGDPNHDTPETHF